MGGVTPHWRTPPIFITCKHHLIVCICTKFQISVVKNVEDIAISKLGVYGRGNPPITDPSDFSNNYPASHYMHLYKISALCTKNCSRYCVFKNWPMWAGPRPLEISKIKVAYVTSGTYAHILWKFHKDRFSRFGVYS